MNQSLTHRRNVVAGLVHALCACCAEQMELASHPDLDATQMLCPTTGQTYLDRGDGVFEQDGRTIEARGAPSTPSQPEILSDRPTRTQEKERIMLERATFA